jgi:DNA-binding Lrp family transcriptional regulator
MDSTDRQLLSLLRDNARVSVAALAKTLRVARGTVQNRLARMEKDGTIVGYTVKLKPQDEDQRIRALMTVAVEGNRTDEVLRALRGDPAVCALHTTSGGQGAEQNSPDRRNLQHGNQPATLHS